MEIPALVSMMSDRTIELEKQLKEALEQRDMLAAALRAMLDRWETASPYLDDEIRQARAALTKVGK